MHVLAYVQEPLDNAGSRCRIAALQEGLAKRGIRLTVHPPVSVEFAMRHRGSRGLYYLASLANRLWTIPQAAKADAVIIFRGLFPIGPPVLVSFLRLFNRRLVFDFDDAIWLRPPFATGGYRWVDLSAPAKTLRRCKAGVVGSPWLEEYALRHCQRAVVIPSCLDMSRHVKRPEQAGDPLVVGWTGSRSGFTYLHQFDDVWRELQRRHGIVFRVVSNGTYTAEGLEVDNIAWSLDAEVEVLRSFDIGIMPLSDTPFERGKAGFKLIQYLAVGAGAVASPVGVNRDICGEDEERGLLASTSEDWLAQVERLITNAKLRRRLGDAGHDYVHEVYDIECAVEAWENLLNDIVGQAR